MLSRLSYRPALTVVTQKQIPRAAGRPELTLPRPTFQLARTVGLGRVELPTSPLSGARSNQRSASAQSGVFCQRPKLVSQNRAITPLERPQTPSLKLRLLARYSLRYVRRGT